MIERVPELAERHNLPLQLTSFVGRVSELAELGRLLARTRLLTLTGAPGVGKTRLALQLADEALEAYDDGVWLVELAPLADPALLPQAVAAVLGVREQPGRQLLETLGEALREQQLLLILDNCEHIVAACATLANTLLRSCPQLEILATSREVLGIAGETTWRVPPLALPDDRAPSNGDGLTALVEHEAVRLFVERARAVVPGFVLSERNAQPVTLICRRLDGIPLALELAAARVRALPVEQLAPRLDQAIAARGPAGADDRFRLLTSGSRTGLPRQQTLRAAVDWSYTLLPERERVLLRRLAVFAGGWTLEAAEEVCSGDGIAREDVLELLVELVNKSLVLAEEQSADGTSRYRMLEMIRQYAGEKLREAGEEATLARRHLEWLVLVAEKAPTHLRGTGEDTWLERFESEVDNLRAALVWSQREPTSAELGLRLVAALWMFWYRRGRIGEGQGWLEWALTAVPGPAPARVMAIFGACVMANVQGETERAEVLLAEGLALARELGDKRGMSIFIYGSGGLARGRGDLELSRTLTEESLVLAREVGERLYAAIALGGLGMLAYGEGDYERASAYYDEAFALYRELNDRYGIAWTLHYRGLVVQAQGNSLTARSLMEEGLRLRDEMRDVEGVAGSLEGLAAVALAQAHPERAARLLGAAQARRIANRTPVPSTEQPEIDRVLGRARASLGEEAFAAAWAEGRAMLPGQDIAYAIAKAEPIPAPTGAPVRPPRTPIAGGLSRRELDVVLLVARGMTNRQIAEQLIISEWTVDTHVRHILTKLDVRSRARIAAWAIEQGLLTTGGG